MNISEISSALEAVLFACGSPVQRERLTELFDITGEELTAAAEHLRERLNSAESGIQLIFLDGSYQLCTKSCMADMVRKALEMKKTPPLSKAALEVLAIVAYNQPVTRSFIDTVRGVDSSFVVGGLMDKGLVCEKGVLDAPGRPTLLGTGENFLRCFGLESLAELPDTGVLMADSETVGTLIPEDE